MNVTFNCCIHAFIFSIQFLQFNFCEFGSVRFGFEKFGFGMVRTRNAVGNAGNKIGAVGNSRMALRGRQLVRIRSVGFGESDCG